MTTSARPRLRRRHRRVAIVVATVTALVAVSAVLPQSWPLGRIVQGAETGVATGLLAVGLVLVYRTTRIINFAYGAMGSLAGEIGLIAYTKLSVPWGVSVAIAVAAGAAIGLATDFVLRRFANAPRLVVTVATIGLLQVFVGLQFGFAFWSNARLLVAPFSTGLTSSYFTVGTTVFNGNDAVLMALVATTLGALAWFLRRTDAGSAIRAVADNHDQALLLGIPVLRISRLVWIVVGAIAGGVLILSAPGSGLPANPFVATGGVFMPALAAAVIAKLDDLPVAFSAGIGLGVFQALVSINVRKSAIGTVALLVVVLAALMLRRWTRHDAGDADTSWPLSSVTRQLHPALGALPEVRGARAALIAVVAAAAVAFPLIAPVGRTHSVAGYLVFGIVAVSLVISSGWAGSISLGQYAVVGVGGVAAGYVIVHTNVDLFLAMALAGLAGAAMSVVIGLPALRVRPLFLAVTTLLFAAAMDQFFLNPSNYPGLIPGDVERPVLWKRFPLHSERAMYYLVLAVLVAAIVVAHNLRVSRPGRVLLATRDNPRAAAAMTVAVMRLRVASMVVAGIFAGVAGALVAVLETGVGGSAFPAQTSVLLFSMAVVGGLASISGALAGVAVVELMVAGIGLFTSQGAQFATLGTGVLMLVVLLVFPGGLGEAMERIRDRFAAKVALRRGLELS